MTRETYGEHTRDKFGAFQDEWNMLAREQADSLARMMQRQESRIFCPDDAKQIKRSCAELITAIEEMASQLESGE